MANLTVSEAAIELENQFQIPCAPRTLSDLIYTRRLDAKRCPLQNGRRLIPRDYLPRIAELLRARGRTE